MKLKIINIAVLTNLKKRLAPCLLCITGLFAASSVVYADRVSLGSASPLTVLSASGAVNCSYSIIEGDVSSAVAGTKTGCAQNNGVFAPISQDIQTDFDNAYSTLAGQQCDYTLATLAGQTLAPGTYCVDAASTTTGSVLTLNGNDDDTWLFKIGSSGAGALTGTDFVVEMIGGAQACNVAWWVADAVTLTRGDFKGDILAGQAVTVTGVAPNSPIKGRIMAKGTVVLTNANALGCVAEAAAGTDAEIAAALAEEQAAEAAELLAVINSALLVLVGPNAVNIIGAQGETGNDGAKGDTVVGPMGPQGLAGSGCSISQSPAEVRISCGDGSQAVIALNQSNCQISPADPTCNPTSQALNLEVDCNNGGSVNGALASAANHPAPVVVTISGVCQESVGVFRDDVTLRGLTPADGVEGQFAVYVVNDAKRAVIDSMTLKGSFAALTCAEGGALTGTNLTITNSGRGVLAFHNGDCQIVDSVIRNGERGLVAGTNSYIRMQGSIIEDSAEWAGLIESGGTLYLEASAANPASIVRNNQRGLNTFLGGALGLVSAVIENNFEFGLQAHSTSSISLGRGAQIDISNNGGDGVVLQDHSSMSFLRDGVTINNNGGYGIQCYGSTTIYEFGGGTTSTMVGNGAGDVGPSCNIIQTMN